MGRAQHRGVGIALAMSLVAASCDAEPPPAPAPPGPSWLYAPAIPTLGIGADLGPLGRGQPPQPAASVGIAARGTDRGLSSATLYAPASAGPALAVISGLDDAGRPAVDVVEIDSGQPRWRAPCEVAAVTLDRVVCREPTRVVARALADGTESWSVPGTIAATLGDQLVIAAGAAPSLIEIATGGQRALALPAGVTAADVRAVCSGDRFAVTGRGELVRFGAAGPALWTVPLGAVATLDACSGDSVRATVGDGDDRALVAIARSTGKISGRVAGVRGAWPARAATGAIEIATRAGVARWPADLTGEPAWLGLPPLGELVATRGDRRLVRLSAGTAVLLDPRGVLALLAVGDAAVALGDRAFVGASAAGDVRRVALPPPFTRRLRGWRAAGVAVPAELRDLPALQARDPGAAEPPPVIALDPDDPAALYAIARGARADLIRFDLRARTSRTVAAGACGAGTRLAVARGVVICGDASALHGVRPDGSTAWDWAGAVAEVAAAGDAVLARAGGRGTLLAAADGQVLGTLAADDGGELRAALVTVGGPGEPGATWVLAVEGERLVARLPTAALAPVWSRAIAGTVTRLAASGDGVLVALDDGDAYRVDARTGAVVALAGLGQRWTAFGDTLVGATAGGPIPPADLAWLPPPPKPLPVALRPPPPHVEVESPPPFAANPWPAPPPLPASLQLTLFDPGGGTRARNDYAIATTAAIAPARGPAGSPVLVGSERELLVLDPARGDAVSRVARPAGGREFSTVVDGKPLAGAILGSPLRLVMF